MTVARESPEPNRLRKRNFVLNAAEGAIFSSSGAFVNPQTVLPALVARLGGGEIAVGALGVMVYACVFLPQLLSARYVETHAWKKRWALTWGAVHRSLLLVMAGAVFAFGGTSPALALGLFLFLYMLMQSAIGIATPGWFDLFAKVTSPNQRGRLIGIRTSIGGGGALLCGFILTWFLGRFLFPFSFVAAILVAFVLQAVSFTLQVFLVEAEPSVVHTRRPVITFLRELPDILRNNPPFRRFLEASMVLTVATMPIGFFTVHALQSLGATEANVGEFTMMMVAVQMVSAPINGFIADRFGNKSVLVIAAAALLCASLTALVAPTVGWYVLVYLFLGVNVGTETMARYSISIEFGPVKKRSTYIGLMNTVLAPLYLCGMLGGILGARWGLKTVFAIGAAFSIAGILILLFRVEEPVRHGSSL